MGVDRGGAGETADSGWSTVELHAMLGAVGAAVDDLARGLDTVGLTRQLREAPSGSLHSLDRSLPHYPLEELLLTCEAYATVTAPAALAADNLAQVRDEAQHIVQMLQTLAGSGRGRRRLPGMGFTVTGSQNVLLRSAFSEPQVQASLSGLISALSPLAAIKGGEPQTRRRALRIGWGCFIPAIVLGSAITLVVFLLTSFALATGQSTFLSGGFGIPVFSGGNTASIPATATANAISGVQTPTTTTSPTSTIIATPTSPAPRVVPTQTPVPVATATSKWTISKTAVAVCPGSPDSFTISYTGRQPISWAASWADHANVSVSPSSGTLQPGGSTTVTVDTSSDKTAPGTITITASNGLQAQNISYDTSNC